MGGDPREGGRDQGRSECRLVCVEKWVEEKWRKGCKERPARISCWQKVVAIFCYCFFFLLDYTATIVLRCSPSAIDSLLSHTHLSASAKLVKLSIVYPPQDTPLKNCRCAWQVGSLFWEEITCLQEEQRKAKHLYLFLFDKQSCTLHFLPSIMFLALTGTARWRRPLTKPANVTWRPLQDSKSLIRRKSQASLKC